MVPLDENWPVNMGCLPKSSVLGVSEKTVYDEAHIAKRSNCMLLMRVAKGSLKKRLLYISLSA